MRDAGTEGSIAGAIEPWALEWKAVGVWVGALWLDLDVGDAGYFVEVADL
jgi:hypothetical protein